MFFSSSYSLLRILVVGVCAYVGLILFLRISGKRTLSKLNAFDLVVTVALGSTLSSAILQRDTALLDGLLALGLLIFLQYAVAWLCVRWPAFNEVVKSQPRLLFYRGEFLRDALRAERVTDEEVHSAVRASDFATLEAVEAVVLETDGTISVLRRPEGGAGASTEPPPDALKHVRGADRAAATAGRG